MLMELGQEAIDLGIVVSDSEASLHFYRDLLGMDHEADTPMPMGGGGTMHRLRCGKTLIKLVSLDTNPETPAPGGGVPGALGYRYFSIHANNIEQVMDTLDEAGVRIIIPTSEVRPGVTIGMVADPDGNVVEFVRYE